MVTAAPLYIDRERAIVVTITAGGDARFGRRVRGRAIMRGVQAQAKSARAKHRVVGTRPVRHDGVDKVTGRAQFGADFALPDMLWGRVLRSPHAHARIVRIDTSRAEALPGVAAVVSARDLPEPQPLPGPVNTRDLTRNVLAREKVLYHGHAVAAVAATSEARAQEALALIDVEYEPLPVALTLDAALANAAPILHEGRAPKNFDAGGAPTNIAARCEFTKGDVERGFSDAHLVLEREFRTQTVHQGYIEPQAVLAQTGADGRSTLWCCTQGAFMVRTLCSALLGLPGGLLRVVPSEIGGGFGGKTTVYLEPLALLLSRRSGRPVKMVMSREEVFRATGPGCAARIELALGARSDGTLTAARARMWYEAGAFPGSPVEAGAMCIFAPYQIENLFVEGFDVCCNKAKTTAYRAPGAPQAAFAMESLLDELARALKLDPLALRSKNAARKGTQLAYGPRFREIGLEATLEAARAHPHYQAPLTNGGAREGVGRTPDDHAVHHNATASSRAREGAGGDSRARPCGQPQRDASSRARILTGRGVAVGFWFNAGMNSSAEVHLGLDGSATVITGNPDIGGSRASLAMLCAEELGVDVACVRPVVADTDAAPYTDMTGGSRVTFATGLAVVEASRKLTAELRARAAKLWDCDVAQVEFREGRCWPPPSAKADAHAPLSVAELAAQMSRTGGPLNGQAQLTARGAGPSFATHICDVQVDAETGRVDVLRYTAIQDAGCAVHPSYVEGQMQGGAAQGIGWALNEEYWFDENGALANAGFLDYRIPVASDLPMIDTVVVEVPNPTHPYGVRGVGETPIVPPLAAVANAVRAATGVRMVALPISPPRLLAALTADAGES